jgi:hypothetical protein
MLWKRARLDVEFLFLYFSLQDDDATMSDLVKEVANHLKKTQINKATSYPEREAVSFTSDFLEWLGGAQHVSERWPGEFRHGQDQRKWNLIVAGREDYHSILKLKFYQQTGKLVKHQSN